MKAIQIICSLLILFLSTKSFNAKNVEDPNSKVRIFETSSYKVEKIEIRKFTNKKFDIVYSVSFGYDISGNITTVDLEILSENLTSIQKADFIKAYRAMIEKFTSITNDGKKSLIFP